MGSTHIQPPMYNDEDKIGGAHYARQHLVNTGEDWSAHGFVFLEPWVVELQVDAP